ncbi:MG2 domain-containing protein [Spongiivirga sp. MCCC 1A20706]|uniref:alpha-2-macroglobulin family protein n=1 Tax=Spongiivirga sp. MCCC 1A20706 TaxID=3160963 RepID=UPI003977C833
MKRFLALVLLTATIFSCKDKATETDNLFNFKDYIHYTTSGRISIAQPIQIDLAKEVAGWETGQILESAIIKISPSIEGTLKAANKRSLIFQPSDDLQPDTEYKITLNLRKIYDDLPSAYKQYSFSFKTIEPNFNIVTNNLQSYSKQWQYLEGVIKTADIITLENAKKLVSAIQNKKDLSIKFDESVQKSTVFDFKIDSIEREVEDTKISIKWNGNAINADNNGENTVTIPGINNFTIIEVDVIQSPEQYLSINFSDQLKKQQNFDGLVSISGVKNPNFTVDGNVLKVYPGSRVVGNVQVDIFQGIKNTDNYRLKKAFSETISFEELKPQVRLVTNGVILPNSQNLKFNFEAVSLKKVDVRIIKIYEDNMLQFLQDNNINGGYSNSIKRVGRRIAKKTIQLVNDGEVNSGKWSAYSVDLASIFNADPGAMYRIELSFKPSYSLYDCGENSTQPDDDNEDIADYNNQENEIAEEEYWDNLRYNYRNYRYNWNQRENPCHEAYYHEDRIVTNNLLASNLGVIAKRGTNKSYYFAVTNILTTEPQAGTTIKLFNFQQQEIGSINTDNDGLAIFDADNYASFAMASKGNSTTYIKLDDGNSLSLSKFNVSGRTLQRGLKGFIYGERGVWRPGDSLHLTFMLNDNGNKLPKKHPVRMEVTDPSGKLIYKKILSNGVNNVYAFKVPTNSEDKTGNWNATVSVGGARFYKSLKVETVKPNRLKIKFDFENEVLSSKQALNADLNVQWLHGAPAKNLKAEVRANFTSSYTGFKKYPKYIFNDPTRTFRSEEMTIFEGNVNEEGSATINKTINIGTNAPGMLNVSFLTRAFEQGGDFSIDAFSKKYSPYESYVGIRSPKSRAYGSYYTDENTTFDIVTVDENGKPVRRKNLEVRVYQVKWRWWWSSSYDNLASYASNNYHRPFITKKVNTNSKGEASVTINVPDNDRGRYLIRVYDPKSGHATGRTAYFYKNWWRSDWSADSEAASMLVFSTDKEKYNVGETATVTFPSGSEGRALVSVENGTEVLQTTWIKTKKGETKASVQITKEMAPNVFINISLLQPHAVTENDLPLRLYGVIPIMVEDANTRLDPQISMPDELQPEKEFTVKVHEKNNKAMTYTVAVVDDGLLDLTRFKTPNAWNEFYAREALGVKTWDIYDYVMGAYGGSIEQVFSIGGDGEAGGGKKKKANRFKPVVKYLGPFSLKKGETKSHKITMPNYVGSVRTMVVAGDITNAAYGNAEKTTPVKKSLMVLATLPRKLSPGEKVSLPVSVFAMDNKVKNVSLSLKLSDGISVVGEKTKSLSFAKPDEKMAFFELDVSKAKGINKVQVIATGNGEKSTYEVEIDVVNPNPITTKFNDVVLEANTTQTIPFETFGVVGTNAAQVEFSTLPPMDFTRRMEYLIRYPHGCVEQTTSSVFPQLYLADIFDMDYKKKQEIEKNVKNGIKRLSHFQQPNGGMSYWIGENTANDWGTSYAGHFMIEAEKKSYTLPLTFMSNWIRYQKQAARDWRPSYKYYRSDVAQAYRLYTLALSGNPDLSSMNRLREFSEISNDAKWRLAAAYALAGQKEAADKLMARSNIDFKAVNGDYYTYGSVDRNRAMALETMVITGSSKAREVAEYLAKQLSSDRWMSTQTTAYSLLAMAKMVEKNGGKALNLKYAFNDQPNQAIDTKKAIAQRELRVKQGSNSLNITNNKSNVVYVRVVTAGKLPLGEETIEQRGLSLSVSYTDAKGNAIDVSKLTQGTDIVANISVSNLKREAVKDIALTQIFPSGWEIVNTRFTAYGNNTANQARYTDIRDDRVNFYFDLSRSGSTGSNKKFSVLLNAAYLGKYYLPGTQAEAMYDNDYLVRNKGQWVEIEK